MKIEVTWKHINAGRRLQKIGHTSAHTCPIALALKDAGCEDPTVLGEKCSWLDGEREHHVYHLPQEAQEFVMNFDDGRTVEPFEFEIYA